jgi:uncharacterized membrane protein YkvA (DUF1232 family)
MTEMVETANTDDRAISRGERKTLRRRMKELLLLLPNLVKLLVRLLRDSRVSRADKVILAGTILYVIAPLDFLPDMIPFIGQVDDAYLVAISVLRILNRADEKVVSAHWEGSIDIKRLVGSIVDVATVFLPQRIRTALTARIDVREPRSLRMVRGGKEEARKAR